MKKTAIVAVVLALGASLSAYAQCSVNTAASPIVLNCDTDVKKSSEILLRVWNTGTGGASQRFVAADGSDAKYQVTHHSSWTAEIAAKNSLADGNANYLQFRVRGTEPNSDVGLAGATKMTILGSGNVGIGVLLPLYKLHVNGNAHIAGTLTGTNIQAQYQDIAEWVPATSDLAPGTVVVLNTAAVNQVTASSLPYDTRVAGVVSGQPGITLGIADASKEQVATTGRVLVNVDATAGPIQVGDLLVTSGKPGTAMKSQPLDINGRQFHQPGTIIGKALEPLASGQGQILVLLSLQ